MRQPGPEARSGDLARVFVAVDAAESKKGDDIVVLDVGDLLSITGWFVFVSASNTRQVRTIVDDVEHALREYDGSRPIGVEGRGDATWVLLDYGDFVVHVFLAATREYYDLDRLWSDAARVEAPVEGSRQASR
jgi:ribosome-associated protein